ncbi:MAG: hypothetical protein WC812_00780 [Candidatus Pacearchaeota archaeon]|jgi:hypothetical protein
MKNIKYWLIPGIILVIWEVFWFIRFKLTINVAQAIAKTLLFGGLYLLLIYLFLIIIFILIKQKKKTKWN